MKLYHISAIFMVIGIVAMFSLFIAAIWTYGEPVPSDLTSFRLAQTGIVVLLIDCFLCGLTAILYEEDK